jgi:hypothetical protein
MFDSLAGDGTPVGTSEAGGATPTALNSPFLHFYGPEEPPEKRCGLETAPVITEIMSVVLPKLSTRLS